MVFETTCEAPPMKLSVLITDHLTVFDCSATSVLIHDQQLSTGELPDVVTHLHLVGKTRVEFDTRSAIAASVPSGGLVSCQRGNMTYAEQLTLGAHWSAETST